MYVCALIILGIFGVVDVSVIGMPLILRVYQRLQVLPAANQPKKRWFALSALSGTTRRASGTSRNHHLKIQYVFPGFRAVMTFRPPRSR